MTGRDEFEYPDEAGYPDGTGTLDEGTASGSTAGAEDGVDRVGDQVETFAEQDEEDVEGV
ncbi:hypothetical protein ACGGZK_15800 [Agromyces sp. MMS24-K17]|uniref:hypothetical protein n=1 Tax=Agromyces sp. MMS24-K17 TaxID=3372850 RepID=UPI00375484F8